MKYLLSLIILLVCVVSVSAQSTVTASDIVLRGRSEPATSSAKDARIYYDAATSKLRYSVGGAAYADFGSGGGGSGDMVLADVQTVTGKKTFGTIGAAVGKFALAGSTSGSTILNAAAVAGSGTVVLPTTGTLATLAGTETFTNKTLTSPALTTPALGVATATSINGLTITSSTGTLTITNGKTASFSNTLTFTGTDSSSVAFGVGGTVAYTANDLSAFASTTSAQLAGIISNETGSGVLVFATTPTLITPVLGVASATSINKVALTAPATSATLTLIDGTTITGPSATTTLAGTSLLNVFSAKQVLSIGGGSLDINVDANEARLTVFGTAAQFAGYIGFNDKFGFNDTDWHLGEVPSDGFIDYSNANSLMRIAVGGRVVKIGDVAAQGNNTILTISDTSGFLSYEGGSVVFSDGPSPTPDGTAVLTLTSTVAGFLPPRMTTTERDAIPSPTEGLWIHNLTTHSYNYWNGSTWAAGGSGGANTTLSNLGTVAINTSLLSDTDNTDDLGSSGVKWKDGYFAGTVFTNLVKVNGIFWMQSAAVGSTLVPIASDLDTYRAVGLAAVKFGVAESDPPTVGLQRAASSTTMLEINNLTLGTWRDLKVRQYFADATVTGGGTTGAQTINKSAGSVNFAATATSLVVTNSLVSANSVVQCTVATNDTTFKSAQCVPTSGSFTVFANAAATAETRVNFIVFNN